MTKYDALIELSSDDQRLYFDNCLGIIKFPGQSPKWFKASTLSLNKKKTGAFADGDSGEPYKQSQIEFLHFPILEKGYYNTPNSVVTVGRFPLKSSKKGIHHSNYRATQFAEILKGVVGAATLTSYLVNLDFSHVGDLPGILSPETATRSFTSFETAINKLFGSSKIIARALSDRVMLARSIDSDDLDIYLEDFRIGHLTRQNRAILSNDIFFPEISDVLPVSVHVQ